MLKRLCRSLRGLIRERLRGVDGAEQRRGLRRLAGELVGAAEGVLEVDEVGLRSACERFKDSECTARVVLREVGIGEHDGRVRHEDAVGMAGRAKRSSSG